MPATLSVPDAGAAWPAQDLESVDSCPYCDATERTLGFAAVQDWTFGCAPGRWDYWRCAGCAAIYLNPRPSPESIARAYSSYYTHRRGGTESALAWGKTVLRHTCYLAWHDLALQPRLPLPRLLFLLLTPLRRRVADPSFMLQELNRLPRGLVLDVGCGNGDNLVAARQLGWEVLGLEIDPQAARTARAAGVNVDLGDYRRLAEHRERFDCLICSHVIEHVHEPRALLHLLVQALKPGGTALISLPNASSAVLAAVGANWRGLEAPRHLSIPAYRAFTELVRSLGFELLQTPVTRALTLSESLQIARRRGLPAADIESMEAACPGKIDINEETSDFINLVLRKV